MKHLVGILGLCLVCGMVYAQEIDSNTSVCWDEEALAYAFYDAETVNGNSIDDKKWNKFMDKYTQNASCEKDIDTVVAAYENAVPDASNNQKQELVESLLAKHNDVTGSQLIYPTNKNCVYVSLDSDTLAILEKADLSSKDKACFISDITQYSGDCLQYADIYTCYSNCCKKGGSKCTKGAMKIARKLVDANTIEQKTNSIAGLISKADQSCLQQFRIDKEGEQVLHKPDSAQYEVFVSSGGRERLMARTEYESGKYSGTITGVKYSAVYQGGDKSWRITRKCVAICRVGNATCDIIEHSRDARGEDRNFSPLASVDTYVAQAKIECGRALKKRLALGQDVNSVPKSSTVDYLVQLGNGKTRLLPSTEYINKKHAEEVIGIKYTSIQNAFITEDSLGDVEFKCDADCLDNVNKTCEVTRIELLK